MHTIEMNNQSCPINYTFYCNNSLPRNLLKLHLTCLAVVLLVVIKTQFMTKTRCRKSKIATVVNQFISMFTDSSRSGLCMCTFILVLELKSIA